MNFAEKVLAGQSPDIDHEIEMWHLDKDDDKTVYEYLGVSYMEYARFIMGENLTDIILSRGLPHGI